jgi:hypothetical protein
MSRNTPNSTDPNEMAAKLMEFLARDNLKDFFAMFRKDYEQLIDFEKGYEFLDEELPYFVSKAQLAMKNAFTLFVKVTLKTGKPTRLMIHLIWEKGGEAIKVGIADVPDNVVRGFYVPHRDN